MFPVFLNLAAWKAPLVFGLMPRSDLVEVGYYRTLENKNVKSNGASFEEKKYAGFIALLPWTNRFLAGVMADASEENLHALQRKISLRTNTVDFGTLFSFGENFGIHTDLYYRKETTKNVSNLDSDLYGFISNAVYAVNSKFSLGVGVSFSSLKVRKEFPAASNNIKNEFTVLGAVGYVYQSGKFRTEGWVPGNAKATYSFSDYFALTLKYKLRSSKFFLAGNSFKELALPEDQLVTLRRTSAFVAIVPEFVVAKYLRIEPQFGARILIVEKFEGNTSYDNTTTSDAAQNSLENDNYVKNNFSKRVVPFAQGQLSFKF